MNHLNYNKYIKQIDTENTIEFECEESDLSDYSDYSDTNVIVYEQDNVSLLALNYVDQTHTDYLEKTFVDIELETNTLSEQDNVQENIEEDTPIPFKEKIRHIHNRQKNIICSALKCTIL
jgi:hypothetical protein